MKISLQKKISLQNKISLHKEISDQVCLACLRMPVCSHACACQCVRMPAACQCVS